jgi:hypothetical protein
MMIPSPQVVLSSVTNRAVFRRAWIHCAAKTVPNRRSSACLSIHPSPIPCATPPAAIENVSLAGRAQPESRQLLRIRIRQNAGFRPFPHSGECGCLPETKPHTAGLPIASPLSIRYAQGDDCDSDAHRARPVMAQLSSSLPLDATVAAAQSRRCRWSRPPFKEYPP